jgi:hypothetical protein
LITTPSRELGAEVVAQSSTFPDLSARYVVRDGILDWIEDSFGSDRKVVVIRGPAGIGKTVQLAQFVETRQERCLSFFVADDTYARPARFLYDVSKQICVVLGKQPPRAQLSSERLRQQFEMLWSDFVSHARVSGVPHYLVIDGLDNAVRPDIRESILDYIPTQLGRNVFLLLSTAGELSDLMPAVRYVPLTLPPFSLSDTEQLLREAELTPEEVNRIHERADGSPAYIAEVLRLFEAGASLEDLLAAVPGAVEDLFAREWSRSVQEPDEVPLAVLVAGPPMNVRLWAEISKSDASELELLVARTSFIESEGLERLRFVSPSYRTYAQRRLAGVRAQAEILLVDYYERDPFAPDALAVLPELLARTENHERLKDLVSNEYLIRVLTSSGDLGLVRSNLRAASLAAKATTDIAAELYFSGGAAFVTSLFARFEQTESEIAALCAHELYERAVELASAALLPQHRLPALAIAAREMVRAGLEIPPEVIDAIDQLAGSISALPQDDALRVAKVVFEVRPDAAIAVLDRSIGPSGGRALDRALALLTLSTASASSPGAEAQLRDRISDADIREMVRYRSPFLASMAVSEAIAHANTVEDVSARLLLLRDWCLANRNDPDAGTVVRKSYEWIRGATSYTPSVRLLRQLSEPIASVPVDEARSLVDHLVGLREDLPNTPLREDIRLDLMVAALEYRWSPTAGRARIDAVTDRIAETPDLALRPYGWARLLLTLHEIGEQHREVQALEAPIRERLSTDFDALLALSADHYGVARRVIRSAAAYGVGLALDLARRLNLVYRRDGAISDIVDVCMNHLERTDVSELIAAIDEIRDRNWVAGPLVIRLASRMSDAERDFTPQELQALEGVIARLPDPLDRAQALAWAAQCLWSSDNASPWKTMFTQAIEIAATIDEPWRRADVNLLLARIGADLPDGTGLELLERSLARSPMVSEDPFLGRLYVECLGLDAAAVSCVLDSQELERHVSAVTERLARVPSRAARASVLIRLASRLFFGGKESIARGLLSEALDLFDEITDEGARIDVAFRVLPLVAEIDIIRFRDIVPTLPDFVRDGVIDRAVDVMVTRVPGDTPVDINKVRREIDWSACRRVLEVLSFAERDGTIWKGSSTLVRLVLDQGGIALPQKQLTDLADSIENLANAKLPDPLGISHDGYKVLCMMASERLRLAASRTKPKDAFATVRRDAENLPNVADRVFVLAMCAEDIGAVFPAEARRMLESAYREADEIPALLDRADRFEIIAKGWTRLGDVGAAREAYRRAFLDAKDLDDDPRADERMRGIIEAADELDPQLAQALTPLVDDHLRQYSLEEHAKQVELARSPSNIDRLERERDARVSLIARSASTMRASIAAGRAIVQNSGTVASWLFEASDGDLYDALPVLAWAVENENLGRRPQESRRRSAVAFNQLADCPR